MRNKLLFVAMVLVSVVAFSGCAAQKVRNENQRRNIFREALSSIDILRQPLQYFNDLNDGVEVSIQPVRPVVEEEGMVFHLSGKGFFTAPTLKYVRSMGFTEKNPNMDYKLVIVINRADVDCSIEWNSISTIDLDIYLKDTFGKEVFLQKHILTSVSRTTKAKLGLSEAYTQALEQINWNRIASFLRTEQLPKEEPQKQVQGLGDTALEQTIIRWDVQSRPQGADIFWRVVSKTPEVKSTNNKYLMTTPYEATKALDIRGLTYQTSGNVRIILRCEKDGYMPQEKEYDVRMVLDQEEISAFFRLVKEE